jgi:hypothetical protein
MRKEGQMHTIRDVRCACAVCGAHVLAWEGHAPSGWCSVCGSYDVRPLVAPSGDDGLGRGELLLGQQPVLHGEQARGCAA